MLPELPELCRHPTSSAGHEARSNVPHRRRQGSATARLDLGLRGSVGQGLLEVAFLPPQRERWTRHPQGTHWHAHCSPVPWASAGTQHVSPPVPSPHS